MIFWGMPNFWIRSEDLRLKLTFMEDCTLAQNRWGGVTETGDAAYNVGARSRTAMEQLRWEREEKEDVWERERGARQRYSVQSSTLWILASSLTSRFVAVSPMPRSMMPTFAMLALRKEWCKIRCPSSATWPTALWRITSALMCAKTKKKESLVT